MRNLAIGLCALTLSTPVTAQELFNASGNIHGDHAHHEGHYDHHNHNQHLLRSPAGVMSDHLHPKGGWMFSYRFMQMQMEGNRDGTNNLTSAEIAANVSNPFGPGGGNTRVVPTDMNMDMHMFMAMYAPTDWLTLMVMANYQYREMGHTTFQGGSGTTVLGEFTTASSGFGDTTVGGIFGIYEDETHKILATAGLSLPTGSNTHDDDVLAPTGARPRLRLPYAMQLGSGTFDLRPQLTYVGQSESFGWGAQYDGTIRLGQNSENYTLGDRHQINLWGAYQWHDKAASTLRLTAETEGDIDGFDALITAPVTTADPENYGGERVTLSVGTNWQVYKEHILNAEFSVPFVQDLNGPQLERDYAFMIGWQTAF